ncbi:MAG: hypothetical protein EOP32_31695 [Rhodococcus sp. (in: high G+C Gram-positive bacteria)]|nr:MAG: hypothetical protein EOP32_31695 [Rhodococcus sp. (in: high G+C Gram-positive bacteria)]
MTTVIVCGNIAGTAQEASSTGSRRALLARTGPAVRAGLMSTVHLFSYSGAAIPSLIAGRLSIALELDPIALGYAGLAILAAMIVLATTRTGHA